MSGIIDQLTFFVNGKLYEVKNVDPQWTLIQFLRSNRLTGTKLGCGEGGCGACTVMLSSFDVDTQSIRHLAVNACLTPICAIDGCAVTTVEGIGGMAQGYHPVQQRIASAHGSQCGFCTPGIVMSIYAMLRSNPNATPHEIEESLDGNLCRCTGYRPIIDAARSLSNNKQTASSGCCKGNGAGGGGGCPCKLSGSEVNSSSEEYVSEQVGLAEAMTAKGLTEPIFPPLLMRRQPAQLRIEKDGIAWHQPLTLTCLLELKQQYPNARLVVGNTEVGIETKFKYQEYHTLINPMKVEELRVLQTSSEGLTVGAGVTLNRLLSFLKQLIIGVSEEDDHSQSYKYRGLKAIADMLSWFASNQIRNVACVGGNICTASPISDLNPILLACGAVLRLNSALSGARQVPISQFFLSYRKVDMQPSEILESVFIPFTSEFEFILPYKQARRREDDISIVNAGIRILLAPERDTDRWLVKDCTLAYGGMAPTTLTAKKAAAALIDQTWTFSSVESVFALLRTELALAQNVPGGQPEYRMALTVSFLFKAYLSVSQELSKYLVTSNRQESLPRVPDIESTTQSGSSNFLQEPKPSTRGQQSHVPRTDGLQHAGLTPHKPDSEPFELTNKIVGDPLKHKSAELQASGEATYTDDIFFPSHAVHAALVMSSRVHARVKSIDTTAAEKCPGFVKYISKKDVIGSNIIGIVERDEEVFATEVVTNVGAIIGIVVCETHEQAWFAARKVEVTYEEDLPPIISILEAIEAGSFYEPTRRLISGDLDTEREGSDVIVSGTLNVGSQEHFYLETNCTRVIPMENNQMEVHSACQNLAYLQQAISIVCDIPSSKIHAKCRRMGGAFGGKESRAQFFAVTAALAAKILQRPVSIMLERDVDMSITGQRHAFHLSYEAGMTASGQLKFLKAKMYCNGGNSKDLSVHVLERGILHLDSIYRWPAMDIEGRVCKTNKSSNTAFRGFGSPQVFSFCEMILGHLARKSGVDVDVIRHLNLYQEGDRIPCGQRLVQYYVPRLLRDINTLASVAERREAVAEFNRQNRYRKRGICVLGTKYGINFEARFLNKGGSLVHIYTDGTVLVSLGGTEMGQGLYTKMIQVAAQCLGIPHESIHVAETATTSVANASSTAGSMSTDLYGMAVLDACEQLKARLDPFRKKMEGATWEAIVIAAYFDRVDLTAHGFYSVAYERCGMSWGSPEPQHPFNYFTQGAACTEVEIDCLTGDFRVIRTDILMDLGKSINPAIDIGQIEGAFTQGLGYCTMEELVWGDKEHPWVRPGHLFTKGPGTYKIPAFNDVPIDFRVHLADTDNSFAVHSSKAVGEPPFYLGCSAFFAIQNAVTAARAQNGASTLDFHMEMPATSERIRMACADSIVGICTDGQGEFFIPKASY